MEWIKHNVAGYNTDAFDILREKYGFYGYGLYWRIMERITQEGGAVLLREILSWANKSFTRNKLLAFIQETGLFYIDEQSKVRFAQSKNSSNNSKETICSEKKEGGNFSPDDLDTLLSAHSTQKERNKKKERKTDTEENKENEVVVDARVSDSGAEELGTVEGMTALLCREQIWRESLLTTRPSARDMLEEDFAFCMRFALQCSLSEGRDQRLSFLYMAKRYIGNYLGNPDCVARLRNAYIREHQQTEDERLTYDQLALHYPHLQELSEPLTKKQLDDLIARHGTPTVSTAMKALNNFADLHKRYTSAFYAIETWSKKTT